MNGYEQQYSCSKCGNHSFDQEEVQSPSEQLPKFINVQNKKFIAISCSQCGYTELYRAQTNTGMNILDFLFKSKDD